MTEAGGGPGKGRLEAFSDGVFAVAITLLALDLTVDGPGHGTLAHQLDHRWPAYAAYVVSFFTIGVVWINHHSLLAGVRDDRVTRTLLYLNLTLLLFIVAIPFGTSTAAEYLTGGGADAHLATALYGAVLLAMGLSFGAMFVWAIRGGHLLRPITGSEARRAALRFTIGNVGYLAATGVAFLSAPASLIIDAVIAVYYVSERTPARDA